MPRRLLCTALAALLAAPAALAADAANLTIYHADNNDLYAGGTEGVVQAGHALVHEARTLDVKAGSQELRIGGLPETLDPEAVAIGFAPGAQVSLAGQRVVFGGTWHALVGREVTVTGIGPAGASLTGTLLGSTTNGQLLRTADGALHMVHQYAAIQLPADAYARGSTLLLDVDAKRAGSREARLTYLTSGLGWRAAYSATLDGGAACHMRFKPEASIANRSGRDYPQAAVTLVAGQPNLGNRLRLYGAPAPAAAPTAAMARALPAPAALGDYRSFTLAGPVSLPSGTVTLSPLYPPQALACQREYIVEDGGSYSPPRPNLNDYGAQDYRDRAIASTLAFVAPEALPAGTLRAWLADRNGTPQLLGEGSVPDTPKGQRVAVELGQSFDLRASRERTAFHVDARAHTLDEAYTITLTNGGDRAHTVTLREHPNRWREWTLTAASRKPSKRTPQLVEFAVPVPANGKATLTYAIRYTWTAQDL